MFRLALAVAAMVVLAAPAATARPLPGAPHCPLFPSRFSTNQRVDRLPVAPELARDRAVDRARRPVHADFGSGRYAGSRIGIPFDVVGARTPRSRVGSTTRRSPTACATRSLPASTSRVARDRHALLVDRDACRLYELFALQRTAGGWHAGSGATWNLRSTRLRPKGWTSADAAGLPILPLLARYDEVRRGRNRPRAARDGPHTRDALRVPRAPRRLE